MIGQHHCILLVCFLLFFSASQATGVLHVDTVFSSSESKIVVDNMTGVLAETGHAETHEVEFANFASLGISAPQLDFHGSYLSIATINDAVFTSTDDSIDVIAGHNLDVNAGTINIAAHTIDIESVGEILLLARDEINVSAEDTVLLSGDGGATFSSLAGDVSVSSPNGIIFDAFDALSLRATNDLSLISTGNSIFTADSMYLFSDNTASIDSSSAISMVSSVSSVKFDSHDLSLTLGSLEATGGGQALLQSFGDELGVYGFTGVTMSSFGDINIAGASDGATFIATGDEGAVLIGSEAGTVTFTSEGSSGHARTYLAADSIYTNVQDFQITSNSDTHLTGDRNILVDSPSVAFDVRRDAFLFSERKLSFSAGTSFGITADLLALTTEDATINMSALLVETEVGNLLSMTSNNFVFAADNADFVISAGSDINIKADFTQGRRQKLNLSASSFTISEADLDISGGHATLAAGDDFNFSANGDFGITANEEKFSSEVNIIADDDLSMSLSSWRHDTGDVLFTNDVDDLLFISFADFDFEDISLTTNGKNDINIYATSSSFLTALDDFQINVGRDMVASLEDDWDVTSQTVDITVTTSDFYATADRFFASVEVGHSIEFLSNQDTVITTHRNENTDDELIFEFSDGVSINVQNIFLGNTADGAFTAGDSLVATSNELTLSSGTLEGITMNAGFFVFNVDQALTLNGNSLLFDSAVDFTVNADTGSVDFIGAYHGVDMYSEGTFDFQSTTFGVNTNNEILVWSGSDMTVGSNSVIVSGSESNWVHVKSGDLTLNAFNDITTHSARNMTLTTGGHTGDTFLQISDLATISANDLFAMDVEDSLAATAVDGTVVFDTSLFSMSANTAINMVSPIFIATGDVVAIEGGDITFTTDSSTFISTQASSFSSFEGSHSNGEFDNKNDYFLLQSMLGSITSDNTGSFTRFISSSDTSFQSAGSFLLNAGNNLSVQSIGENQDINISTTAGDISFSSLEDSNFRGDGDLWMTAADGLVFDQEQFEITIFDSISVNSEDASINIISEGASAFGVVMLVGDIIGIDVSRDNTLSITSTMESTYTSNNGIIMSSDGSSESRRDTAGDSNAHQHLDQLVGFSARTYQPDAHIVFDARSSDISWSAGAHLFLDTGATMIIETLNEQNWVASDNFSMESEDGSIVFNGATGITLSGQNRDTFFLSYGYTDATAKQNILLSGEDDSDITSYHSDIQVTTFTAGDISTTASRFTTYEAGLALDVFAQGDMSFTSGDEFDVVAERGFSLEASGDIISFTSVTNGNTIASSEEIYILAGGDLTMSNPGLLLENMKFEALSTVFTSTGGDITFNTNNILSFEMERMLVNAFGTSAGKRDNIQFTAPTITMTAETRGLFVDATEEMLFGTAAVPTIMTLDSVDHTALTSVGNVGLTTDNIYGIIADSFQSSSVAETAFKAGGTFELNSAAGSISFSTDMLTPSGEQIIDGAINLSIDGDFTNTVAGSVSWDALHQNAWDVNLMTITTLFDTTIDSAASISQSVGSQLILTTAADAVQFKVNPGAGEMHVDVANDMLLDATSSVEWDANNYLLLDYDGPITFIQTQDTIFRFFGQDSALYFDSSEAMSITADTILMQSVSMSTVSGESNLEFLADLIILGAENDFYFSAEANLSILSVGDSLFQQTEAFQIFSENDIAFTTVEDMSFLTSSVQFITLPGGDGDILWDTLDTFTIATDVVLSMDATGDIDFSAGDSTFDAARDINIIAAGERSELSFEADTLTSTAESYNFNSGDDGTSGDMIFEANSAIFNIGALQFLADASEIAATSSIEFELNTSFDFTSNSGLDFIANSNGEGQQGTITFDGESNFIATDGITFTAEEASFEVVATSILMDVTGSFSMNTHGYESGIEITTPSMLSPIFGGDINFNAGDSAEFILEHPVANFVTTSTTLQTTGPAGNGNFGAKFTSSAATANIGVTGATAVNVLATGSISALATDSLGLTAVAGDSNFMSASKIEILARGSRVGQYLNRPNPVLANEAIHFASSTNLNFQSAVLSFETADTLSMFAGDTTFTSTLSSKFSSTGDMELDFGIGSTFAAANSITMESDYGGIQFVDEQEIIVNGPLVHAVAGAGFDDASVTFTPGSGNLNINLNIAELLVEADANIMVTSYDATTFNANDVLFEATTGDILFRSITVEGEGDGPYDVLVRSVTSSVTITAFERIEHRQHENLAFFTTSGQAGTRTADEAPQQSTTVPAFAGNARPNGCNCSTTVGACSLECPDSTNRILQMQRAFIDYGLLF